MKQAKEVLAAFTAGLLGCTLAQAQSLEPFKSYDRFAEHSLLDPARWAEFEQVRQIKDDGLRLMQRTWPFTGSDTGSSAPSYSEHFVNPAAITAIKAKITVKAFEVSSCAANTTAVGDSRARIAGIFFNVGPTPPVPGSNIDDMHVQVRVIRQSNSNDAAGVLRVEGIVVHCMDPGCASGPIVGGSVVPLGNVSTGTPVTVEMQWDKANKQFLFSRDNGTFSGSVVYGSFPNPKTGLPYSDSWRPGVENKNLQARLTLPNCQSGPRVSGMIDAMFDNVSVNNSVPTP
jgi:hypothetical protein